MKGESGADTRQTRSSTDAPGWYRRDQADLLALSCQVDPNQATSHHSGFGEGLEGSSGRGPTLSLLLPCVSGHASPPPLEETLLEA